MGIAKSIQAYSVYENYNSDIDSFIRLLSDTLNADFVLNIFDKEYDQIGDKDALTKFGKENQYRLTINFDEYKIESETSELPTYEISLPIKYIYEDSLELTFYPNHSVHITFLTFEHLWGSFIDILKFKSAYEYRPQAINRYQVLRSEYSSILQKIGINQIFIATHAYYEIENVTDTETYHNLTFEEIIQVAKEKDKFTIFNFQDILNANDSNKLDKTFLDKSELDILLVDTFEP